MHMFTYVYRTALETIERLSRTLDFSDYASQIIHAIVQVGYVHCTYYGILYDTLLDTLVLLMPCTVVDENLII